MKEQSVQKKTGHMCSLSLENQPSPTGISRTRGSCTLSTILTLFSTGKHHLSTKLISQHHWCCVNWRGVLLKLCGCKHTSFATVIPYIFFPIFRAVRFSISKQSPISFIQHYKLQHRSSTRTKQNKVRYAPEWLMATISAAASPTQAATAARPEPAPLPEGVKPKAFGTANTHCCLMNRGGA